MACIHTKKSSIAQQEMKTDKPPFVYMVSLERQVASSGLRNQERKHGYVNDHDSSLSKPSSVTMAKTFSDLSSLIAHLHPSKPCRVLIST